MVWKANDEGENNRERDWLPVYIKRLIVPPCHAPPLLGPICVAETHSRTSRFFFSLLCFTADTNHYDVHSSFTCKAELIVKAGESFMAAKAHEYCTILIALFVYFPSSLPALHGTCCRFPYSGSCLFTFYVCSSLLADGKWKAISLKCFSAMNQEQTSAWKELKNLFLLNFPTISKDFSSVSEVLVHVHHDWVLSIKLD